jgi:hypothetical protein
MWSLSPTLNLGHSNVWWISGAFLIAVHRSFLGDGRRAILTPPHPAPRPAICTTSGLWLVRYGQTPLWGTIRFTHPRQVLTGQSPSPEMDWRNPGDFTPRCRRPVLPDHHGVPDSLRDMIERCWREVPSQRMSAGEALSLLETELRSISNPADGPVPNGRPT